MRSRPWASRWLVVVVSGVVLAASVATTAQKPAQTEPAPPAPMTMDALLASLPVTRAPGFDEARAQWLVAQPFACLDELQPRPGNRPYFWEATFRPVDNYDKVRAFYGCGDWHSAVNATWTLTVVLKRMPEISVGRLIREKLTDHLGKTNLDGEVAFFKDAGTFERPYGYAWLLTLGAELQTWDDTQAAQWAANLAPLSKYFSEQIIAYLKDLDRPVRTGGQTNTALVLTLALDASETLHDYALRTAVLDYAKKSYTKDVDCATDTEPTAGDLVSPCLSEAALMSRVLDRATFVPWLDKFLPAPNSPKFRPLLTASTAPAGRQGAPPTPQATPAAGAADAAGGRGRGGAAGGRANPIGLALSRAEAFNRLADALPESDPRAIVFRRAAAIHADVGVKAMIDPAAVDAPWLGAFALRAMSLPSSR